jgi:hypothetical protein
LLEPTIPAFLTVRHPQPEPPMTEKIVKGRDVTIRFDASR